MLKICELISAGITKMHLKASEQWNFLLEIVE
jgi:hypothetical protein